MWAWCRGRLDVLSSTGVDVNLVEETRKAVPGSEREGARWDFFERFHTMGTIFQWTIDMNQS